MTSERPGESTLAVDVGNVTRQGFWLLLDGREYFLPFEEFPWFRDASIESLTTIERPSHHHLYWPKLDIDLAVDSIEHPERYPLVSRGAVQPNE
jgi:hypothetical protein